MGAQDVSKYDLSNKPHIITLLDLLLLKPLAYARPNVQDTAAR